MHSGMSCVWHVGWQVLTGNILTQRVSPWGVGGTKAKTPSPPFGSAGGETGTSIMGTGVRRGEPRMRPGLRGGGGA